MQAFVLIFHVIVSILLIALVLMQQGKGASMGASFGGGSSNTMFGSVGAAPFLMKVTGVLVVVFFITSLALGYLTAQEKQWLQKSMELPGSLSGALSTPDDISQQLTAEPAKK